jgi:hypothetical protein
LKNGNEKAQRMMYLDSEVQLSCVIANQTVSFLMLRAIKSGAFVYLLFFSLLIQAEPPELSAAQLASPPARIVRTCCGFGADVKVSGIPFVQMSDVTSVEMLGEHHYLGGKSEANGLIYSDKGGFIDIGHLRDVADWTAYIYGHIARSNEHALLIIDLGREGGRKSIEIELSDDLSANDKIALAARVAIDLSTWHEIATWFGASYLPLIPERYSSFSPEDMYSNLLGALIAIEAISDPRPYEVAMTALLNDKLLELGAVESEEETFQALESVRELWWSSAHAIPSRHVLLKRYFGADEELTPWLIDDISTINFPHTLRVPLRNSGGSNWPYLLRIDAPKRLPLTIKTRLAEPDCLDQFDFRSVLDFIAIDSLKLPNHKGDKEKTRTDNKKLGMLTRNHTP